MSAPTMKKATVVLATWPENRGARYFGHDDSGYSVDGCDSFWLSFRSHRPGDDCHYMDESARAVNDIGMYVWFDERGAVQTNFAIHDSHNMNLREAEARLKALRKFDSKMPSLCGRNAESFRPFLMDIFNAIGVTQAIEYRHLVPASKSAFVPIYDAVEAIGKEFDKRYAAIRKSS